MTFYHNQVSSAPNNSKFVHALGRLFNSAGYYIYFLKITANKVTICRKLATITCFIDANIKSLFLFLKIKANVSKIYIQMS